MRARVEAAIADLGFVRDEAARHLRAGYSTTIGVMLLDAWNPSFIDVARGVEAQTTDGPWTILMSNSARDTKREQRYLREYAERRVAGLIVVPNDRVSEEAHALPHGDIPMVVVDRAEHGPGTMSVAVDDLLGGSLVADHLAGLGHRKIAFVGDTETARPVLDRFIGFQQRLAEICRDVELEIIRAPLTAEAGLDVGRELVSRSQSRRPTAVAAAVDLLAFGVMQSLLSAGIRLPDDISLTGYDDTSFSSQLSVPMTSIARPHYRMGTTAADMLLSMINGTPPTFPHVVLQPELVVRASTGVPLKW